MQHPVLFCSVLYCALPLHLVFVCKMFNSILFHFTILSYFISVPFLFCNVLFWLYCLIQFYSVAFISVLSCSTLILHSIQFYINCFSTLFSFILFSLLISVLFCSMLLCITQFYSVRFCSFLFRSILFCTISSVLLDLVQ